MNVFCKCVLLAVMLFQIIESLRFTAYDKNAPFIGTSIYYLFIYGIGCLACVLILVQSPLEITYKTFITYIALSLISSQYMVLFFIKRYAFNKVYTEYALSIILYICNITTILYAASIKQDISINCGSVLEHYQNLICYLAVFKTGHYFYAGLTIYFIPLITLFALYYKSITKKYDKNELGFYPKSANKPLTLFFLYRIAIIFCVMDARYGLCDAQRFIWLLSITSLKVLFFASLLRWLKNRDMEKIEKLMIIRGKKC